VSATDVQQLFERVPPARQVRELLSERVREVQRLRALLKLAEANERLATPARRAGKAVQP
jgi:hypothetical protein